MHDPDMQWHVSGSYGSLDIIGQLRSSSSSSSGEVITVLARVTAAHECWCEPLYSCACWIMMAVVCLRLHRHAMCATVHGCFLNMPRACKHRMLSFVKIADLSEPIMHKYSMSGGCLLVTWMTLSVSENALLDLSIVLTDVTNFHSCCLWSQASLVLLLILRVDDLNSIK